MLKLQKVGLSEFAAAVAAHVYLNIRKTECRK